ncbi:MULTISPECIES: ABC transporter substrate-binding protein [unclassified Pseudofrankia]|uniref:ABC transporter substrate-binding protein n=1 Tax=unclassified Pseudofrankia TaxID=2994372 RepID=UPI0008D8FB5E|nr:MULTISPECIES: ABC transporter substrate-binding protein [unclassified Pseudofrankia]MDT3440215.1 ABC transporter substrate-binding protein [Pseudofrankia sp. BMG5.37]OHV42647.1 branched-chain amino acid ABC transporter substrate-binding protein [Pseudofrankia sp. BMG5.36]
MRILRQLSALRAAPVAVVAVLVVAAAACGGSSAGGSDVASLDDTSAWVKTGPTTGPSTGWSDGGYKVDTSKLTCTQPSKDETRGITDTSITVEGLAYLTSPGGASMQGADVGAKVRFDAANEAGGINGRKIDFRGVLDDGQDASRNLSQANIIATRDRAFAAVPVVTSLSGYADVFCQNNVPYFGWGTNDGFCDSALAFGVTGCNYNTAVLANNLAGLVNSMFPDSKATHTLAIVGQDLDSSRTAVDALKHYAEAGGTKVIYAKTPIPAGGLTDATAIVQAIMTANGGTPPEVVYYITDFATTLKLIQSLKAAGYPGKNLTPIYDPALSGLNDLDGMYATGSWLPGIDDSNKVASQMVADFKKYAPDQRIGIAALAGYWSADLFVAAATAAGKDLTVDKFVNFLNAGFVHNGDGAVPETRWPLNHFVTTPCSSLVQLTGGTWKPITQLTCGSLLVKKPAKG